MRHAGTKPFPKSKALKQCPGRSANVSLERFILDPATISSAAARCRIYWGSLGVT